MFIGEIARQAEAIMPSLTLGLRRPFADAKDVLPPPEPPFNDARCIRRNVAKRGSRYHTNALWPPPSGLFVRNSNLFKSDSSNVSFSTATCNLNRGRDRRICRAGAEPICEF